MRTSTASSIRRVRSISIFAWRSPIASSSCRGAVTAERSRSRSWPSDAPSVSGDIENGAPTTAVEKIQEYMIGGAVVWRVPGVQRPRLAPFVAVGGGYLRQLHDRALLAQTGRYYALGGGVAYLLASRSGWLK